MSNKTNLLLIAILLAFVTGTLLWMAGQPLPIVLTASITVLTATLWVTEALPIPVTSLIPFVALPMAGVISHAEAASALGSHVIILLMGAFMLSKAVEKSQVHKRLALNMLRLTGAHSAKRLVLGFMLTSAILSMWISNTATTLMLLPIVLAGLGYVDCPRITTALLLGIAYAASLGGVGTPIGTPPNIIFMSVYAETQGEGISFLQWMKTGIPIVLLAIPVMALWLTRGLGELGKLQLPALPAWHPAEKRVLGVFLFIALAWVFRPYWTSWAQMPLVGDSTIALAGVILMFLIPSGEPDNKGARLLDWQTAASIPWGLLLLFAGGICLAKGFQASGLSALMGQWMTGLVDLPVFLLVLGICLFVTFLTEITSNTATATLLMPILASAAIGANVDPAILMMPAAISASCAFMLPVATAPNAIVYGTEKFPMKTMAREGMVLNVMVAFIVATVITVTR